MLGALDQRRVAYDGAEPLLAVFTARSGLQPGEARTLLAKFNLGADHVERAVRDALARASARARTSPS